MVEARSWGRMEGGKEAWEGLGRRRRRREREGREELTSPTILGARGNIL
jgi:hypothetical protein